MVDPAQDALETIDLSVLERTFAVNTYGPLLLTQALLPNIVQSSQPRLGFMSSRVGSIEDNSTGGSYAYRASKTALNSFCKSMAVELKSKGVVVVIMHPGIVKVYYPTIEVFDPAILITLSQTNLTAGLNRERKEIPGAVEPEEAASKLHKILISKGIEDTGKFWHREGQELPW